MIYPYLMYVYSIHIIYVMLEEGLGVLYPNQGWETFGPPDVAP